MVEIVIDGDRFVLEVQGWHKLWALKSRLEIPVEDVVGAHVDPTIAHGWWKGIRMPGTHLPNILTAGTFYQNGKKIFWDVADAENTIVIDLQHEDYDQLIVEVLDPVGTVEMINGAVSRRDMSAAGGD
jgi:hypothetical protein